MDMSLNRFKEAQQRDYETALREIGSGRKRSHWMWYIIPQLCSAGIRREPAPAPVPCGD